MNEKFNSWNFSLAQSFVWVAELVREPERKAADPGSSPGPGENFFC